MTNPADPQTTNADVAEDELDEAVVLAFLERHPDFLAKHPDVLASMAAPGRWSGEGVVDMQQFLIDRKGQEMAELRDAAQDVIETSRTNMSVQMRTHAAVLSLMAARAWDDLLRVVIQDWPLLLDVETVSIGFEVGGAPAGRLMDNDIRRFQPGYVESVLEGGQEVRLYRAIQDDGTIFGAASGIVSSAAIARIHAGTAWPSGLLALGARSDAFQPGQGTELISFLSRVLESCLARAVEIENA